MSSTSSTVTRTRLLLHFFSSLCILPILLGEWVSCSMSRIVVSIIGCKRLLCKLYAVVLLTSVQITCCKSQSNFFHLFKFHRNSMPNFMLILHRRRRRRIISILIFVAWYMNFIGVDSIFQHHVDYIDMITSVLRTRPSPNKNSNFRMSSNVRNAVKKYFLFNYSFRNE